MANFTNYEELRSFYISHTNVTKTMSVYKFHSFTIFFSSLFMICNKTSQSLIHDTPLLQFNKSLLHSQYSEDVFLQ